MWDRKAKGICGPVHNRNHSQPFHGVCIAVLLVSSEWLNLLLELSKQASIASVEDETESESEVDETSDSDGQPVQDELTGVVSMLLVYRS